jgi:quercetin dioxygenase-like cupin family protein
VVAGRCVYGGKGSISVELFSFGRAPAPANFLIYDLPPGSSEGVHVHRLGDQTKGSYDEYFYIVSGTGQMEIDGKAVRVEAGNHICVPLDVQHGIENTPSTEHLRVFLT